jgi:hypothetical protein
MKILISTGSQSTKVQQNLLSIVDEHGKVFDLKITLVGYFITQTSQTTNAKDQTIGEFKLDAIHFLMQASSKGIKLMGQDGLYGSGVFEYGFYLTHHPSKFADTAEHLNVLEQSNRDGEPLAQNTMSYTHEHLARSTFCLKS